MSRLLTVHPSKTPTCTTFPETQLASVAAESIGIELVEVDPGDLDASDADDSAAQGDAELEPLEDALTDLEDDIDLAGVTAGAIESEFQTNRIQEMCDRLGIDLFAPLWQRDPEALAAEMLEAGFEITILQVAAYGLDESWLGRTLDADAIDDLRALNDEYGVHLLGEGGEFETFVTDGPHMEQRIELDYDTEWNDDSGRVRITDAGLSDE
ncbi:MAG: heavy metal translocating P-type ATPase [Halonotius sp. J07HN6]|nr:MAG: heavy metal translocating P-type ATPase [Halonotius sp. J07HN6]